jgi:hypothetical protein
MLAHLCWSEDFLDFRRKTPHGRGRTALGSGKLAIRGSEINCRVAADADGRG